MKTEHVNRLKEIMDKYDTKESERIARKKRESDAADDFLMRWIAAMSESVIPALTQIQAQMNERGWESKIDPAPDGKLKFSVYLGWMEIAPRQRPYCEFTPLASKGQIGVHFVFPAGVAAESFTVASPDDDIISAVLKFISKLTTIDRPA